MNVWSRYVLALSTIITMIVGPFIACAENDAQPTERDAGDAPEVQVPSDASSPDTSPVEDASVPAQASRCSDGGFCLEPVASRGPLFGISGSSMDDVWAIARDAIFRWDVDAWKKVYQGTGGASQLFAISAEKHDDVWALGQRTLVRYSARGGAAPAFREYRDVIRTVSNDTPSFWLSPTTDELWIVNGYSSVAAAYRYRETPDGSLLEDKITDPAIGFPWVASDAKFIMRSVFGFAPDDVYVGGAWCTSNCETPYPRWEELDGVIAHYDGASWSMVATLSKGECVSAIFGQKAASGPQKLWVWTGADWSSSPDAIRLLSVSEDAGAPTTLFDEPVQVNMLPGPPMSHPKVGCHHLIGSVPSSGGAWFSNVCLTYRWSGAKLDVVPTLTSGAPIGNIFGIWAANEDEAWIVGEASRRNSDDIATGFAARRTRRAP